MHITLCAPHPRPCMDHVGESEPVSVSESSTPRDVMTNQSALLTATMEHTAEGLPTGEALCPLVNTFRDTSLISFDPNKNVSNCRCRMS